MPPLVLLQRVSSWQTSGKVFFKSCFKTNFENHVHTRVSGLLYVNSRNSETETTSRFTIGVQINIK